MTRKRKSEPIDHGLDPILEYMREKGLPMDREHYLAVCFPEGVPDKLSAEEEAELPESSRSSGISDRLGIQKEGCAVAHRLLGCLDR